MQHKSSIPLTICMLLLFASCDSQELNKEPAPTAKSETASSKETEPHRYGGWYCPDNFGFAPVDIQKLDEVPAISNRLPTNEELEDHMSLIRVDTEKHPNARALKMELPRVARIHSRHNGMHELIIVIQAIVVNADTVVGYRFPNGGNGSAWMRDVTFLSEDEVDDMGAQPFFYAHAVVQASKEEIWNALGKTDYFKRLGEKFDEQDFFSSAWNADSKAHLDMDMGSEKATGFGGTVYGNPYLHIDYDRDGFHYSEKLLMIENPEDNTTELFVATGPFPENFEAQQLKWDSWFSAVKKVSEAY